MLQEVERGYDFFKKMNDVKIDRKLIVIDDDLLFTTCANKTYTLKGEKDYVIAFVASTHVYIDRSYFEQLKKNENFIDIVAGNKEKVHIKGVGSIHFTFHNGVVGTLCHMRYVLNFNFNLIAFSELTSHGYTHFG